MYVTLFPCQECSKLLVQAGITKVVFFEYKDYDDYRNSKEILEKAGVSVVELK